MKAFVAMSNASKASNAYHPLLSPVTKGSFFFNFQMNGASKCRGMCATIEETPANIKDYAFLVRPLIEDNRYDLRSSPRRGPTQSIPPDAGRRVQSMKEQSGQGGLIESRQEVTQNDVIPVVFERGTEMTSLASISKKYLVCSTIIFASPLALWFECVEPLEQLGSVAVLERREREEVGCRLRGARVIEDLFSDTFRGRNKDRRCPRWPYTCLISARRLAAGEVEWRLTKN